MPITWYDGTDGDGVGNVLGEVIDTMLAMVVVVVVKVGKVVNRSRMCMRVSFSPVRQPLVTQFISNLNHGLQFSFFCVQFGKPWTDI